MLPTAISLVGTIVLLRDAFAIVSVLRGSSEVLPRVLWIASILILPVIGMVLSFHVGHISAEART